MAALVKSWYYLPCRRGWVRQTVELWRKTYGCNPEHIGRVWRYVSSGFYHFRGPVYVGPIPPEDVPLWPGCESITKRDLRGVYVWRNSRWEFETDRWAIELLDWRN
jgi:hypothetical protein